KSPRHPSTMTRQPCKGSPSGRALVGNRCSRHVLQRNDGFFNNTKQSMANNGIGNRIHDQAPPSSSITIFRYASISPFCPFCRTMVVMGVCMTAGPVTRLPGFSFSKLRSEEHTSELQSRENLVCRLLL